MSPLLAAESAFASFNAIDWTIILAVFGAAAAWAFRMDRLCTGMKSTLDAESKSLGEYKASSFMDREHLWGHAKEVDAKMSVHGERLVRHETRLDGHEEKLKEHSAKLDSWKRQEAK